LIAGALNIAEVFEKRGKGSSAREIQQTVASVPDSIHIQVGEH